MKQETHSPKKESFKDKMENYEKTIKGIIEENDKLKVKVVFLESNAESLVRDLKNQRIRNEDLVEDKEKLEIEIKTKIDELKYESRKTKKKLEENEVKNKNFKDSTLKTIGKVEKDYMMLKQENSYLNKEVNDLSKRYQDEESYYENIISDLKSKVFHVDNAEKQNQIDEVKTYYEANKKKMKKK